jgi:hypothetical protein
MNMQGMIGGYLIQLFTFGRVALDLLGLAVVAYFTVHFIKGYKRGRKVRANIAMNRAQAILKSMRKAPQATPAAGN